MFFGGLASVQEKGRCPWIGDVLKREGIDLSLQRLPGAILIKELMEVEPGGGKNEAPSFYNTDIVGSIPLSFYVKARCLCCQLLSGHPEPV